MSLYVAAAELTLLRAQYERFGLLPPSLEVIAEDVRRSEKPLVEALALLACRVWTERLKRP